MTKESLKKQNDALKLRVKKLQLENKELRKPKEFWERNHTQTKDIEIKYLGNKI